MYLTQNKNNQKFAVYGIQVPFLLNKLFNYTIYFFSFLKINPNPIRFKNFFSKSQKNLNCPKTNPTIGSVNWYIGKIKNTLNNQYSIGFIVSGLRSRKTVIGLATHAAKEPLIANTIHIKII